jgi:hypothetical protein
MARMRFPGRPGVRVDRVRSPANNDDFDRSADPALQLVSNLRYGLQEFREICGESEVSCFDVAFRSKMAAFEEAFVLRKICNSYQNCCICPVLLIVTVLSAQEKQLGLCGLGG